MNIRHVLRSAGGLFGRLTAKAQERPSWCRDARPRADARDQRPAARTAQWVGGRATSDGWRARVAVDGGKVRVRTRTGRAITSAVPELDVFSEHDGRLLLNGELVAGAGRLADFCGLSGRRVSRQGSARVLFIAFDLLVDDEPIIDQPYERRRRALEQLVLRGLVVTPRYPGTDAGDLPAACEDTGMEGVVSKKLDSPYLPGKRTDAWRNVKCPPRADHARGRFSR